MTAGALRRGTSADSEFCFQLHKAAMGDYLTAVWGGTAAWAPERAHRRGHVESQDLVLDVLIINPRAQGIYRRLGMTEVAMHGDGNIKITMRSGAARAAAR